MDQAILVGPDLQAGVDAIAALDAANLTPAVALLAVFPEYEDWRLVLAAPLFDREDKLKAHEMVARVLRGRFVYTLPTIMILPMKDSFIRELRKRFAKDEDVAGRRLASQKLGDRFVDAGYLYRIS